VGLTGAFLVDTALLLAPAFACALLTARLGVTHWLLLLTAAISGSGALSLAAFWIYLASEHVGRGFSIAVTGLSVLVMLDALRHRCAGWRTLRPLLPMGLLYVTAGFFTSALAYLHVSFASNTNIAPSRFQTGLPADNVLPMLFAKQLMTTHRPLPPLLTRGWQSSDRPPLQTGYYLLQQSVLHSGHFNDYQLLAMLLQCLWVPGLWALLYAMGKPRGAIGLSLTAVLFNGFVFQNSIFTWPKLIAAAALLLFAAIMCTRESAHLMSSRFAGVLAGLAIGTAMMSHPGSLFAVVGLVVVFGVMWLIPRVRPAGWRPPSWRFLWPMALVAAICYEPWSLYYGKHYQPPANALTELQLADREGPVPGKTTTQVIVEAYKSIGVHKAISNKIANFETPFDHIWDYPRWCVAVVYHVLTGHPGSAQKVATEIVRAQFFYIAPILGFVGWGLCVLYGRALWEFGTRVRARFGRSTDGAPQLAPSSYSVFSQEYILLAIIGVYSIAWCLLLFGPWSTIAHQGTYFTELVLIALGVIGFWSLSPRLTAAVVLVSSAFTLWLYVRFTPLNTVSSFTWLYNPRNPFTVGVVGLKGIPTGGKNTDPVTAGSMTLLIVSVALCLVALWWTTSDRRAPAPSAELPAVEPASGRRHARGTQATQPVG
jgi:hypothetical protein